MPGKKLIILILSFALFSCGVSKRKKAEVLIAKFQEEHVIDKRETVFNVEANFYKGKVALKGNMDDPDLKDKLLESMQSLRVKDEIVLLPDSTVGENNFGLINLSVANLRSKPEHSAEMVTQALLGTPVKILQKDGGWYLVQTPDHYISWIDEDGVVPVSESRLEKWKASDRVIYTGQYDLVYKTDRFDEPISDITMGNILNETEQNYKAIQVEFPDGRSGYVPKKDWTDFSDFKNSVRPDTLNMVELAKQLTGKPYLWGGTSALAMDCSGFMKMLYFMNGIILARDASLQTKYGELIPLDPDYEKLRTGDLLFFGRKEEAGQQERVTHVAFSLGKTEYIHASGRIRQNSLDPYSKIYSEYRKNSLVRVRRIIGATDDYGIQTLKNHPWY